MLIPETEVIFSLDGQELLRRVVRPGEYFVGRTPACELCVDSTTVSRKHAKLNAAIAELVDDFSLVAFGTLNITDKQSVARALKSIDKANGYCLGYVDDPNIFSTVAAGESEWDDERVGELARMLGGKTESAREHAKALLAG